MAIVHIKTTPVNVQFRTKPTAKVALLKWTYCYLFVQYTKTLKDKFTKEKKTAPYLPPSTIVASALAIAWLATHLVQDCLNQCTNVKQTWWMLLLQSCYITFKSMGHQNADVVSLAVHFYCKQGRRPQPSGRLCKSVDPAQYIKGLEGFQ